MYNDDPYNQRYPQDQPDAPTQGLSGPITGPNDPRLSDPAYASDPNVQAFLSGVYGPNGTVYNPTPNTPGWNPNELQWNPGAPTQTGSTAPAPTSGPAPAPAPAPGPTSQTNPNTSAPSTAPSYTPPPAYVPPPAFQYADFNAPDPNDLLNDPAYQFELGQGMQAIGAKNAALGTLNTGGTIKDFESYGQNLASTRYNDLFNRRLTEYGTNRGNAIDTYNTNYGTQYRDPYSINYASQYQDPFANNMASAGLQQNNNQFNASLGQNNSQFNTGLDFQKYLQNYKATVTDPFAQKYSLLGLL